MTDPRPAASIVIPAYHSDGTIADCLEALRAQTHRDFETIVVNSSPGDGTRAAVTGGFPEVRYVESCERLLPHAARNRGATEARGDLLVFTDPDCVPDPDWLACLVDAAEAGNEVIVGSMGLVGRGRFARGVHLVKFWWLLPGAPPGYRWIAPTANAAYTRAAWEEAGPFDGDLFASDGLASWLAARRGRKPRFEPGARVAHRHQGDAASLWSERFARGEEFAGVRMRFERWSRTRAAAHALLFPALPALVLARSARAAWRSGWARDWLATLPLQALGQVGWSTGELRAHARRALGWDPLPLAGERTW